MDIIVKSIHIIDYVNKQVRRRETPDTFESYVTELIGHMRSNEYVKEYKTRRRTTTVIDSILTLCGNRGLAEAVSSEMDTIARRLLDKEIEAQELISHINTNVQKGSLVQALLSEEDGKHLYYLLAKVEHTEWVDDFDFSFKTGYSKNKETLWKSCLFDLPDRNTKEFHAKIYSNTVAKYWSEGFLELDEVRSDLTNTVHAIKAIEATLNRSYRGVASPDHTLIRNFFIWYLKNNEFIDYPTMVNAILDNYQAVDPDLKPEKIPAIRERLLEQPKTQKFDYQFHAVHAVIDAQIKSEYPVYTGIDLRVSREIEDLPETIQSIQKSGKRYLLIRTNNDDTYKRFLTKLPSEKLRRTDK